VARRTQDLSAGVSVGQAGAPGRRRNFTSDQRPPALPSWLMLPRLAHGRAGSGVGRERGSVLAVAPEQHPQQCGGKART
jgi:hypothetical protein